MGTVQVITLTVKTLGFRTDISKKNSGQRNQPAPKELV